MACNILHEMDRFSERTENSKKSSVWFSWRVVNISITMHSVALAPSSVHLQRQNVELTNTRRRLPDLCRKTFSDQTLIQHQLKGHPPACKMSLQSPEWISHKHSSLQLHCCLLIHSAIGGSSQPTHSTGHSPSSQGLETSLRCSIISPSIDLIVLISSYKRYLCC